MTTNNQLWLQPTTTNSGDAGSSSISGGVGSRSGGGTQVAQKQLDGLIQDIIQGFYTFTLH